MTIGKSSGRGGLAAALETGYLLMENAKFLIAFALLGMLLSAGYQLERFPPVYEATAKLSQADGLPASLTGERRQAFEAWAVRRAVIDGLEKRDAPRQMERMLRVRNIGTHMLYITARAESPAEAAVIANECAAAARKLVAGGRFRLLAPALTPARPVSPGAARIVLLALVSGGLVISGVMMAQFPSGNRSRMGDDIPTFSGMPILAPGGALGLRQPVRKQAL